MTATEKQQRTEAVLLCSPALAASSFDYVANLPALLRGASPGAPVWWNPEYLAGKLGRLPGHGEVVGGVRYVHVSPPEEPVPWTNAPEQGEERPPKPPTHRHGRRRREGCPRSRGYRPGCEGCADTRRQG